ncbi:MAG: hypothetical protein ACFFDN_14155 [Candidatus Hodarchaeota archaeon]
MAVCTKKGKECQNCRKIIIDTNLLIDISNLFLQMNEKKEFNPYTQKKVIDNKYMTKFNEFLDLILACSLDNSIYCSSLVFDSEFMRIPDFICHNRAIQNEIRNLFREKIKRIEIDNDNLNKLKECLDKKALNKPKIQGVGKEDLSLLLAALDNLKIDNENKFLLVTMDTAFRRIINYSKDMKYLDLNNNRYETSGVESITSTSFLLKIYNCCEFDEFEEFRKYQLSKIASQNTNLVSLNKSNDEMILDLMQDRVRIEKRLQKWQQDEQKYKNYYKNKMKNKILQEMKEQTGSDNET